MTRDWQDYIKDRIARSERASETAMCEAIKQKLDQQERAVMKAIAQVMVDEERQREGLQRRIETLERELAEMRDRETTRRLRAVPSTPPDAAMIA